MQYLSIVADIIGIAGAIFALFAWLQVRHIRAELARSAPGTQAPAPTSRGASTRTRQ